MKDGTNQSDPSSKTEIYNSQFSSVFTEEDVTNLPNMTLSHQELSSTSSAYPREGREETH
ncbi:hypothetical protein DPMN_044474 [Dreissena polymorpha]|uniref:Uncharacterized protein n=1 Tax=Dreissena polymorpha TaxID=45954 RepID=A0A9D4I0J3_DREPO|nr:hypothetical protein DPMN_044474 [Dreissena polymorpha]